MYIFRQSFQTTKTVDEINDQALVDAIARKATSQAITGIFDRHPLNAPLVDEHDPHPEFVAAVAAGDLPKVKSLAAGNPALVDEFSECSYTPIGLAAFFGHAGVVRFLLAQEARVNVPSRNFTRVTPLHCSVARDHQEIARLLLEHGADVDARQVGDFTSLHTAAQNGAVEMARLLLEYQADVNARHAEGGTALSIALSWGHHELADLLRQHGADA